MILHVLIRLKHSCVQEHITMLWHQSAAANYLQTIYIGVNQNWYLLFIFIYCMHVFIHRGYKLIHKYITLLICKSKVIYWAFLDSMILHWKPMMQTHHWTGATLSNVMPVQQVHIVDVVLCHCSDNDPFSLTCVSVKYI